LIARGRLRSCQQAPGFCAQKLSYFWPLEPADGGELESGAAVPPDASAVPPLDAPPVPPPEPAVLLGVLDEPVLVPVAAVVLGEVVPAVPVVPVEPVEPVVPLDGVAVAPGVAVGDAVDPLLVSELLVSPLAPEAEGAGCPFGIAIVAGGPGTSGATGSPPPQPARTAAVKSVRPRTAERAQPALSGVARTSGGRMSGSR
jgi:hypothetical protein